MEQPKPEVKTPQEPATRDELRRRHGSPGIMGAVIVIFLGILLYLANQGIIPWDTWWQYFLTGLGIIFLIDGLVQYLRGVDRGMSSRFIAGIILLGIGITFLLGEFSFWPIIIIVAGLLMLFVALRRH